MELKDICQYVSDRVATTSLSTSNYISTENMLPNKGGVVIANGLPVGNAVAFAKDDVLVSNIRPYFKKIWQANKNGGCSADVLCFRKNENVDNKYFYYLLSQQSFFDHMMLGSKGCKMPRGDKKQIMNWSFDLPSLEEQKRIADILSSLDSKIELNRCINDNLEQQAQALFKSWFVDFEPFKEGKFVDSEMGMIPEGWKVGRLCDFAIITMGQSPSGDSYNENKEGMVFYQGRSEFGNRFPSIKLYTTDPNRIAEKNSILISVRAPVGDINIASQDCCIGRGLASIKARGNYNSFLYYTVKSMKKEFDVYNGEGTVFGSINKDSLNSMPVIIPTIEEISNFEKITSVLDYNYEKCHRENIILTSLRDNLLPRLISGGLKINDLNC
ncbi:restriction endonuclease subunit S [Phocaeicola vulgatus]|uniref:restriction endonuclease subunit S n=1 Tax=Phocaeicola vulgatus TaxID=821 RepID=UPI001E4CC87B|nr:restriction endonuclease subunit S [Phocaeicola vulgatus]MDB1049704.1 restriction endonuclease subunit S [Phocaeicola vulgatus]MDB1053365.1 restriction endonuclease subunit S [Phocaeicola vulgatus]